MSEKALSKNVNVLINPDDIVSSIVNLIYNARRYGEFIYDDSSKVLYDKIRTNMLTKKQISDISDKIIEIAEENNNLKEGYRNLLALEQWNKLLEWGIKLYSNKENEEHKLGEEILLHMVSPCTTDIPGDFAELPENIAETVTNDILSGKIDPKKSHESDLKYKHRTYRGAANFLKAGKLTNKAEELSKEAFANGIIGYGMVFSKIAGLESPFKIFSKKEIKESIKKALKNAQTSDEYHPYERIFDFCKSLSLKIPKYIANTISKKAIVEDIYYNKSHLGLFIAISEYMKLRGNPFTAKETAKFGDLIIKEHKDNTYLDHSTKDTKVVSYNNLAFQLYKKANRIKKDTVPPEKFYTIGKEIITKYPEEGVKFLSVYSNKKEIESIINEKVNKLFEEKDFSKYISFCEHFEISIPPENALVIAEDCENRNCPDNASKWYTKAGKPEEILRLSRSLFEEGHEEYSHYDIEDATELLKKYSEITGNKATENLASFIDLNIRRPFKRPRQ